jgi:membrane fusion protein, heavy metal efflux system
MKLTVLVLTLGFLAIAGGCTRKVSASTDKSDIGPVQTPVIQDLDPNHLKVDDPGKFPLVSAENYVMSPDLNVTGAVSPDVSRQVPVPSPATGRVLEVDVRLGDAVQKGQLLFKVRSSDIAGAFSDYQKAVRNEQLARIQLDRAKVLYDNGAIAKSAFEIAQTNEDNAQVDLNTTTERLKLLGADPKNPTGIVEVYAPVSGVITDQQIANSSGVQALSPPNPFTISDLTKVWIVCDVYENNLAQVRVGEYADIRLNAFPDRVFKARINNISPMIDPTIRTAKVRLEVDNPGLMRVGMFVTATFHGASEERHVRIPASAILHLHDRQWVYTPNGTPGTFKRLEIRAGATLPGKMQEVISGLAPGDRVIANALVFQNTTEQ